MLSRLTQHNFLMLDIYHRLFFRVLTIFIGGIALYSRYNAIPTSDIAWLTLAAERLLEGQKFGRGIYELNVPFAVMLYVPSVVAGRLLSISPFFFTYILTIGSVVGCIQLASKVLYHRGYDGFQDYRMLNVFKISFLCAFLFFPGINGFSQRDHFISACLLPYGLLKLAPYGFKEQASERKHFINIACSIVLIFALLIKPQYLSFVWIINLFSLWRKKEINIFWPGLYLLLLCVFLASLVVIFFFSSWLPVAYDAWIAYPGYMAQPRQVFLFLVDKVFPPIACMAILKSFFPKIENKKNHLFLAVACISVAAAPVFLLSRNPWYYHLLPVILPLWGVAFFAPIYTLSKTKKTFLLLGFLSFTLLANYVHLEYASKRFFGTEFYEIQSILKPGDSYICISQDIKCAFPFSTINGYRYASRYPSLWPTAGAKRLWIKGRLDKKIFLDYLNRDINNLLDDIKMYQPKLIVIEWEKDRNGLIDNFSKNELFISQLKHYKLIKQIDHIEAQSSSWVYLKKPK